MTKEEAGEVILEGHIWEKCLSCDSGWIRDELWVDGKKDAPCVICLTDGRVVNKTYAEACLLLDIPIPESAFTTSVVSTALKLLGLRD